MVDGTVILKCGKKRWEKDSKRAKEFSRWASDSGIYYEFEWLEGDDCLKIGWCANNTDLKGYQEIVKGFQYYLGAFGEVECTSSDRGQILVKIFTRCFERDKQELLKTGQESDIILISK